MSVRFSCPSCGTGLSVGDEQANTKVACPTCQQKLLVPPVPTVKKTVLGVIDAPLGPAPIVVSPPTPQQPDRAAIDLANPEPYEEFDSADSLGITAFVCGLGGLVLAPLPLGIVAIICSSISLCRRRKQSGLALAGLILGCVSLLFGAFIFIVIVASIASERPRPRPF